MSILYRSIIISLALSFNVYASSGGNGGSRGGGDTYSAEVFSIARGIAKKIRVWTDSGILKLADDQIRKVEAIVDLSPTPSRSLLEVYSFDRVYKHPERLPSRAADETALINIYAHTPPRIEVGRILWDGLKGHGIEKEMIVLHELLGAAGLLKNGRRIDDQFKISYELKLRSLEDWETFRDEVRTNAMTIFSLSKLQIHRDRSSFEMLGEQARFLPQLRKVMRPEVFVKGLKKQKELQLEAAREIFIWITKNAEFLTRRSDLLTQEISDRVNKTYSDYPYPEAWSAWAQGVLRQYLKSYNSVMDFQDQYNEVPRVLQRIHEKCGDIPEVPLNQTVVCSVIFLGAGLSEDIDSVEKKWESALDAAMAATLDDFTSPITPDDLTKR